MSETQPAPLRGLFTRRWGIYLAKAAVLLGLLFAVSRTAALLPPLGVALVWAVLSAAAAIWLEYQYVVRKTHKQAMLQEGGRLARFNAGRIFGMILAFAISAACMAGLILDVPTWKPAEWALVALAVPLFPLVFLGMNSLLKGEYKKPYRISRAGLASSAIVGALLCAGYFAIAATQPATAYPTAAEAFAAMQQPFASSPSSLLAQVGELMALVDGVVAYGIGKMAAVSSGGYLAARIALVASAFFGVAGLLGFCSAEWTELKRVFQPLAKQADGGAGSGEGSETDGKPADGNVAVADTPGGGVVAGKDGARPDVPIIRRYAIVAGLLPLCLVAAFMAADAEAGHIAQSEEYTAAEAFIREQIGLAVYILDDKYYEEQAVRELMDATRERSAALSEEARETLVPLINASYDARIANVDSYLDWYYSLPADYERLAIIVTGSVESYVEEQFSAKIEEGIDDSELAEALTRFTEQADSLEEEFSEQLSELEVDLPEWLYRDKTAIEPDFFTSTFEPSQKLLDTGARVGISVGAGVAVGFIAKRVVQKALMKPFFSKIVGRIASVLAARGAITAASGGIGTLAGPLGTAAGVIVGTLAGIGVDFAWLKTDEAMNRDEYRQEIIDAIEEERTQMLAIVGAG